MDQVNKIKTKYLPIFTGKDRMRMVFLLHIQLHSDWFFGHLESTPAPVFFSSVFFSSSVLFSYCSLLKRTVSLWQQILRKKSQESFFFFKFKPLIGTIQVLKIYVSVFKCKDIQPLIRSCICDRICISFKLQVLSHCSKNEIIFFEKKIIIPL